MAIFCLNFNRFLVPHTLNYSEKIMNNVFNSYPFKGKLNKLLLIGFSILLFYSNSYAADLNLAWDASTSTNVGGYKLYYGQTSKNYTSAIDVGKVTTYKMTGLTNGSTYYIALKSYNAAKSIESASYSNEVSTKIAAVTPTPATPPKVVPTPTPPNVVTTPTPPPVVTTTNGLVAAYGFEEIGNNIIDASGNGNHGTIKEATRSPSGYYGYAMKFDGINDLLTVNDSSSLDLSSGLTFEAWVNPAVVMNNWKTVLIKEQPGDEVYSLYANGGSNIPTTGVTVNGNVGSLKGGASLTPNKWSHLAATYDGKVQRLFVDGKEVSSRPQTGSIQQSNNALQIGGSTVWGAYFSGLIDEVRIYNRALSSTEISQDWTKAVRFSNPEKSVLTAAVNTNTLTTIAGEVSQGTAQSYRATSKNKSVITGVKVFLASGSAATELVAGVYSDNAGHPGTLLTQGKRNSPQTNTTNTVVVPPITLEAGKTYWVAILGSKGGIKFSMKTGSTIPTEICKTTGLTTLPATWMPGIVAPNNGPISAYGSGY
jgi:Concanavalin A-like lectin/glucanases superfamily